jgi:hypothetical protein
VEVEHISHRKFDPQEAKNQLRQSYEARSGRVLNKSATNRRFPSAQQEINICSTRRRGETQGQTSVVAMGGPPMIHGHALECPNPLQKDEAHMHVYLAYAHISKQLGSNPLLSNIKKFKNEVKCKFYLVFLKISSN